MDRDEEPRGPFSEEEPLLPHNGQNNDTVEPPARPAFPRKNIFAAAFIISILVFLEASGILQDIPLNQVLEENICRSFLGKDADCSNSSENTDVQAELSFLRGWQSTLSMIPGIVTAVPYGYLTDRHGRKLGLILNTIGLFLAQASSVIVCLLPEIFPVRLIWASSAFTLIGGGPVIFSSIVFAMLADVSPDAYRANVFFYMGAAVLGGELVFSSLAASMMQVNLWAPIYLSFVVFLPAIVMCIVLPETLHSKQSEATPGEEDETRMDSQEPTGPKTVRAAVLGALIDLAASTSFLFARNNQHITLLLATLLTTTLGRHAQEILLQFARNRFGWSWGQAAYLVSLKAFVLVVLLLFLLPASGVALANRWPPRILELWRARISCIVLIIGALLIGLAPNSATMVVGLVVYCVGNGYNLILRSLLADLVAPAHRGVLFNTVSMLENTGAVIASPLLAASFRTGLRLDGLWTGLPYFVAAALFSTALVGLAVVRMPTGPAE